MADSCATRSVVAGQTINLDIRILDAFGQPADADNLPSVEIKNANCSVVRSLSPSGVSHVGTGLYRLPYTPPANAVTGVWTDRWQAIVDGFAVETSLEFVVVAVGATINPVEAQIGDPPCVTYSQAEITGINILLAQLKCRLKNSGQAETLDEYGQKTYVDCPIFTDDELLCFLNGSLSEFNQTPHWTSFGYDSSVIYERNAHVIVEGAHIVALGAQMLIEAGREFTVSDNGITLNPPPLSTVLNNQFGALLTAHTERLKFIKCSYKPTPVGVGTFRVLAVSPAFLRLRHLRQRQII